MNKIFIISASVTTIINIIFIIIYIIYGLIQNDEQIKYAIKGLPAMLLYLHSLIMITYYKVITNTISMNNSLFLLFAYLFCSLGDNILLYDGQKTYILGMSMFAIAYILFGSMRIYDLMYPTKNIKLTTIILILIFFLLIFAFIISTIIILILRYQHEFNNNIFIIAICIYALFMSYAILMNLFGYIFRPDTSTFISFVGIFFLIISDIILIIHDIEYKKKMVLEIITMITYWLGLIIIGWSEL